LSEPISSDLDQQAAELFEAVSRELSAGRSQRQLVTELTRQKWSEAAARQFVACVLRSLQAHRTSQTGRAEQAQGALAQIQSGLTWIVGGAAAVLGLRFTTDPHNLHLVAYLAMVYGLIEGAWGLSIWLQNREPDDVGANAKPIRAKKP
jgi:hypothetical protein